MPFTQITLNSAGTIAVYSVTDVDSLSAAFEQTAGTAGALFQLNNNTTGEFSVAANTRYINRNDSVGLALYQTLTGGTYSFNDFHNYTHWPTSQFFITAQNNLSDTFQVRIIVDATGSGPVQNTSLATINPGGYASGLISSGWSHTQPNTSFSIVYFEINNTSGTPTTGAVADITFFDEDDLTVIDTTTNFGVAGATQTYTMSGSLDYFRRLHVDVVFR